MTDNRDKLIERIRKLRAKGADNGVTEAEAEAFLDAAARLMREWGVADGDLDRAGMGVAAPIEKRGVHISAHKMHPACVTLQAIAELTGTAIGVRVETTRGAETGHLWGEVGFLTIAGRPEDREIADYMFDQVRNLIDGAWKAERERRLAPIRRAMARTGESPSMLRHILKIPGVAEDMKRTKTGVGAKERRSFGFGMAWRLSDRIKAMATRHRDSKNALVVWRASHQVTDNKKTKPDLDPMAYLMGDRAGKDAVLGQGVASGQRAVLQLEEHEGT